MVSVTADDGVWAAVTAAQAMVNFADCWSPMTEEISAIMGHGQGGPFALGTGASKWYDAAAKFEQAQHQLLELTGALPREDWDGQDRAAFDSEISAFAAELGDAHNYALAVAITLTGLCVPIAAWPIGCDTIGAIEAANAAAFYAAAASVVGDLGPAEALFAEGEAVTATCFTVLSASATVLIGLLAAATATIAIADAADLGAQLGHGDTAVAGEFGRAVLDTTAEVALTLALSRKNSAHTGRHAAQPDPIVKGIQDQVKDKGKEKGGEVINQSLSTLSSWGLGSLDSTWNQPDAPEPDAEVWGDE